MAANAATDEEIPNELTWEMQREYDSRRLDAAIGQALLGLAEGR